MKEARSSEARWRAAEAPFAVDGYRGEATAEPIRLVQRRLDVVLSAVHAVKHYRDGKPKCQDEATGGLALELGRSLRWSVAVVQRENQDVDDANANPFHPIKLALETLGLPCSDGLLVDLHGMSARHGIEISIGLGVEDARSVSIGSSVAHSLEKAGFVVDLGARVTGMRGQRKGTMVSWAQARSAAAIQIEIGPAGRRTKSTPEQRQRLLVSLERALRRVDPEVWNIVDQRPAFRGEARVPLCTTAFPVEVR
jgi:hypothetical protein